MAQSTVYDSLKSKKELNVFEEMGEAVVQSPFSSIELLRNFSLYVPRQTVARFLNRYEIYKKIIDVHGSILEFGVFRGMGAFAWLHFVSIFEPYNINRKIFAFDTFEGFPETSEKDGQNYRQGDLGETSYEELLKMADIHRKNIVLEHIKRMEFVKGDITQTLPLFLEENPHLIAALVYIDVDVYKPTKTILQHIVGRIPKGGILAFDELNDKNGKGETIAFLEELNINNYEIRRNSFDSNPCYIVI
jgi:hypothetical protein